MMRVWFLNVGHGDCTIVEHPSGRLTMIDINNSQYYDEDSYGELLTEETASYGLLGVTAFVEAAARRQMAQELVDPIAFLREKFPGRALHRFILTHPDLDHMRGLRRLFEHVKVWNFWDTANERVCRTFMSDADRTDWLFYQSLRAGKVDGVTVMRPNRGSSARMYDHGADGDCIDILAPTSELLGWANEAEKWNDLSLVLRLTYGGRSIILPGDAERWTWDDLVAVYGGRLRSTVLKASHHGRQSGFRLEAVKLISPQVTIASVGRKPDTDAHSHYKRQCTSVWSTRHYGNIGLTISPDGEMQWTGQRNTE